MAVISSRYALGTPDVPEQLLPVRTSPVAQQVKLVTRASHVLKPDEGFHGLALREVVAKLGERSVRGLDELLRRIRYFVLDTSYPVPGTVD